MKMAIYLCDEQLREIVDEIAVELDYSRLKTEQMQAILEFLQGRESRDVFVILPTGYGKSLCYASICL